MRTKCNGDETPSVTQINRMIKEIVKQRNTAKSNVWTSLSKTLNALGPSMKNCHDWKDVWTAYKRNVQKYVDRNGTKNLNNSQRLTYEYIKREKSKNKNSVIAVPSVRNKTAIFINLFIISMFFIEGKAIATFATDSQSRVQYHW